MLHKTLKEGGWRIYSYSLYYFCNCFVNPKLFPQKFKIKKKIRKSQGKSILLHQDGKVTGSPVRRQKDWFYISCWPKRNVHMSI